MLKNFGFTIEKSIQEEVANSMSKWIPKLSEMKQKGKFT
jgi:hypothetical protein